MSPACRGSNGAIPPHPLLQQEDGVRRVAALVVQFPPFAGSEVAVRGGGVTVRGGEAPTSPATSPKTLTTGVVGEVSCVLVAAMPGLVCRSHANRGLSVTNVVLKFRV